MTFFTGDNLMLFLIAFYAMTCLTFLYEGNWIKAMYWFGALTITSSVVMMK